MKQQTVAKVTMTFRRLSQLNRGLLLSISILLIAILAAATYLIDTVIHINGFINQGQNAFTDYLVIQDISANLTKAESNQRGYVLTGNPEFLVPYNEALQNIPAETAYLNNDASLSPWKSQLREAETLINQRIADFKNRIATYNSQGRQAAIDAINNGNGVARMNKIQSDLNLIGSKEIDVIVPEEQSSHSDLRLAAIVSGILALFVLIVSLLIIRSFQSAILRERATESAKNEFLSLASHQLRTPATNVKQYLGLVLGGYFGKINKEQREALEIANTNNETEISIMNDLLNVAKLDLKKVTLSKKLTDICKLTQEVLENERLNIKKKKQTINLSAPKQLKKVPVDPPYFKSIIENLIDNASKYSPDGSVINVSISRTDEAIRISIKDQGDGIKRKDISKLFKKFSRIPNSYTGIVEGTGLGLYWAHRIAELHGASIEVFSKVGKGSEFIVILSLRVL